MENKKIVIIGAGFAGAYLIKKLKNYKHLDIFLIDQHDYFLFTPLLTEVASASLNIANIVEFLPHFLKNKNINFVKAKVLDINISQSLVKFKSEEIRYDYLVIATGAKTNYNILGAKEFSLILKQASDAVLIKERIINHLLNNDSLKLSVIGSGPTGIELIADLSKLLKELNKYLKIKKNYHLTLIGSNSELLKDWSSSLQAKAKHRLAKLGIDLKLGHKAKEVKEKEIILENGDQIACDISILSSGVKANVLDCLKTQVSLNAKGDILVNNFLQVKGQSKVFAFGDVANNEKENWEKLAQVASQQAKVLALNLINSIKQKQLLVYDYKLKGKLLALGRFYAIGEIYGLKIYGFVAWFIWRTVYLFKFLSNRKRFKVALEWTINLFSKRDLSTWIN
jgi:NADH:ubiquinone reductase (H+-translocating)